MVRPPNQSVHSRPRWPLVMEFQLVRLIKKLQYLRIVLHRVDCPQFHGMTFKLDTHGRSIAFPCYKVVPIVWKNITNATQSDGGGRGWQEKRTPLSSASFGWQSALTEDKGMASACPSAPSDERGGMPPVLTAAPQHAHRRAGAASEVSGRTMKKVEPSPSTDSNQMRPPCCSTRAWQR